MTTRGLELGEIWIKDLPLYSYDDADYPPATRAFYALVVRQTLQE
jgi:hypothetical protein